MKKSKAENVFSSKQSYFGTLFQSHPEFSFYFI